MVEQAEQSFVMAKPVNVPSRRLAVGAPVTRADFYEAQADFDDLRRRHWIVAEGTVAADKAEATAAAVEEGVEERKADEPARPAKRK